MLIFIPVIFYAILLNVNEYRGWCDLERYLLSGDVSTALGLRLLDWYDTPRGFGICLAGFFFCVTIISLL